MNSGIVVVGSLNADFVVRVARFPEPGETLVGLDFAVFPGGKGANQAYAVARLGESVRMIGQVGNDAQGDWLKQNLASAGVDISGIGRDPNTSSGIALISIDASGQNQIIIAPGANGSFGVELLEKARDVVSSASLVLLQLEIPIETVEAAARMAKASGARVILDPAPAREIPDALISLPDYVTPNQTELAALTDTSPEKTLSRQGAAQAAHELCERGAQRVIVKMGSLGAMLVSGNQEQFWPAVRVHAVDSTAAGDAFNAAYAVGLSQGMTDQEAGMFATCAGAACVMKKGAQPSMPSLQDCLALMKQQS